MSLIRTDTYYLRGCAAAQQTYGVTAYACPVKVAAASAEDSSPLTGQHALVAGAALSPFAGMVGEKELIHDPLHGAQMQQFKTMDDLAAAARPGDILATAKPEGSFWKGFITPHTGSSFYHIQPVVGRDSSGYGTTASAGEFHDPEVGLSQTATANEVAQYADTIPEALTDNGYTDAVLLRPKNMTKAQKAKFVENNAARISRQYDTPHAVKAYLYDMFVPKLDRLGALGEEVICEGNVCSTLPAQALHEATGRKVVSGKPSHLTYSPDFLRSTEFETVGSHLSPQGYLSRPARKALPYLYRGGVGLGLGAAAYGATEDPAAAVAIPAAAALTDLASTGVTQGVTHLRGDSVDAAERVLPSVKDYMNQLLEHPSPHREQVMKSFYRKKIPLLAAGSLAGLYGLNKLRDHFKKD